MKTTAQKQSAARQREAREQAAATNERIAEQLDMLAQSEAPGLQTIRAGRVMIRATAENAAELARSFRGATNKRAATMRKRQELRFYPAFVSGVTSTAEYVRQYMALNSAPNVAGSFDGLFDLLSMPATPSAIDYTPTETNDDDSSTVDAPEHTDTENASATIAATVAIAQAQASSADAIGATEAQSDAETDAAELVTCEADHAGAGRAVAQGNASSATRGDTPTGSGPVPAWPHTPTHSARPDYSHPVETRAQAPDCSGPVETQPRTAPAQAKKLMMHGRDWEGRDLTGWYISEKLDGCRAFWDGSHLYTKEGNPINAPHITKALPRGLVLDGELWAGRGQFETARLFTQYGKHPERVQFIAFDAPGHRGDWPERLAAAADAGVTVVNHWTARSMNELEDVALKHLESGAEGLMARLPGRPYKPGRAGLILKIKAHNVGLFRYC